MLSGLLAAARRMLAGLPGAAAPWRRHPLIEALTALLLVAVVLAQRGDGSELVLGLALYVVLVVVAPATLDGRPPSDWLLAGSAATAVVLGTLLDASGEPERLLAAGGAGGLLALVALAFPGAVARADMLLGALLGLFLGREVGAALLVALLAGLVAAVVARRSGQRDETARVAAVPSGALLVLGGICALLFGDPLVDSYLARF